jgi:hypothetical protein
MSSAAKEGVALDGEFPKRPGAGSAQNSPTCEWMARAQPSCAGCTLGCTARPEGFTCGTLSRQCCQSLEVP